MTATPSTESVWLQLSDDLRRFIRRRVADDHLADDLLQETFVRIHNRLDTLHDADRLAGWVYQIARNVIYDHYRKPARGQVQLEGADLTDHDADADPRSCRAAEWMEEIVNRLPDTYRETIRLAEIDKLPQQQIADRLGLSLTATKSRIRRGRAVLKQELQQCCRFEFDRRGNLLDIDPRPDRTVCRDCSELEEL